MRQLDLITIWARHIDDGPVYGPQFVAAFPSSFEEALPDSYAEWVEDACERYCGEVDEPVAAFYEGRCSIGRPGDFKELGNLNPDAEGLEKADDA